MRHRNPNRNPQLRDFVDFSKEKCGNHKKLITFPSPPHLIKILSKHMELCTFVKFSVTTSYKISNE